MKVIVHGACSRGIGGFRGIICRQVDILRCSQSIRNRAASHDMSLIPPKGGTSRRPRRKYRYTGLRTLSCPGSGRVREERRRSAKRGLLSELMEQGEFGGWPALAAPACAAGTNPARRLPREARLPVTQQQLGAFLRSHFRLAVRVRPQSRRMAWRVSAHIRCEGVAATGQRSLRTLGGGTRHCEALTVPVPRGIVR